MKKILLIAAVLCFTALMLNCGGSQEEGADAQTSETDTTGYAEIADTSGMLIVENMTTEELEESYENVVIAEAPDFTVYDLNQNEIKLEDFEGYVLLLNFWSMEAPVSKRTFPTLSEIHNEFREDNFTVLGVCIDRKPIGRIQEAVDFNRLSFPVAFGSAETYNSYAVTGPGKSVLIDKYGNIVGDFYDDPGAERLKKVIRLFLNIELNQDVE